MVLVIDLAWRVADICCTGCILYYQGAEVVYGMNGGLRTRGNNVGSALRRPLGVKSTLKKPGYY